MIRLYRLRTKASNESDGWNIGEHLEMKRGRPNLTGRF